MSLKLITPFSSIANFERNYRVLYDGKAIVMKKECQYEQACIWCLTLH